MLGSFTKPDGQKVRFEYDNDGSITKVIDVDGSYVIFGYNAKSKGKQVISVTQYACDGTIGQKMTFDRSKYNMTDIRTSGVDGAFGNTDDVISTYQFNDLGNTVSTKSKTGNADLGASVYEYEQTAADSAAGSIKQLNRVSSEYHGGGIATNLLKNHSFESGTNWSAAAWESGSNTFTGSYSTAQRYFGNRSYLLKSTAYSGIAKARASQDLVLKPGVEYTISAYIKTTGITAPASGEYGDSNWKDKLTSYNGQTITYDAIGNPLQYRDGMSFTWKNGRQLEYISKSGTSIYNRYDSSGTRTAKVVNGVIYEYEYAGGKLIYQNCGYEAFHYSYDAAGNLFRIVHYPNYSTHPDTSITYSSPSTPEFLDVTQVVNTAVHNDVSEFSAPLNYLNVVWFMNQVGPGEKWDIKLPEIWETTIGTPYPGSGTTQVIWDGEIVTPEILGNMTYGYLGKKSGYSLPTLLMGGDYATGGISGIFTFADSNEDKLAIYKGFNISNW